MFIKLSKSSSTGVLEEEGGGNRRPACLVAKQAVQVLASVYIIMYDMCHAHTLTQET